MEIGILLLETSKNDIGTLEIFKGTLEKIKEPYIIEYCEDSSYTYIKLSNGTIIFEFSEMGYCTGVYFKRKSKTL